MHAPPPQTPDFSRDAQAAQVEQAPAEVAEWFRGGGPEAVARRAAEYVQAHQDLSEELYQDQIDQENASRELEEATDRQAAEAATPVLDERQERQRRRPTRNR